MQFKYMWAVGLLASGQIATVGLTYAGQLVMCGLLNIVSGVAFAGAGRLGRSMGSAGCGDRTLCGGAWHLVYLPCIRTGPNCQLRPGAPFSAGAAADARPLRALPWTQEVKGWVRFWGTRIVALVPTILIAVLSQVCCIILLKT